MSNLSPFTPSDSPFANVLRTRRSINDFQSTPIAPEKVLQALELARWAPNHRLTEPWRFHLLGPEAISAVVEINSRMVEQSKGAAAAQARRDKWSQVPGWLVVTCRRSPADSFLEREDYAAVCCAIQNLSLSLWSEGIGTKWTTGDVTRAPEFLKLLQIDPQLELVVGMIWYGIPTTVPPSRRKDVSATLVMHP